jgi:hypothetical protein
MIHYLHIATMAEEIFLILHNNKVASKVTAMVLFLRTLKLQFLDFGTRESETIVIGIIVSRELIDGAIILLKTGLK